MSTDTPSDLNVQDIKDAAALERRLREADIDLDELVTDGATRRQLLSAVGGAAGGAGLAGLLSGRARADPKSTQDGTIGDGDEDLNIQDITGNHADLNSVAASTIIDADTDVAYDVGDDIVGSGQVTIFVLPSDDLQSKANSLTQGDELIILPGTHTVTSAVNIPSDCIVTVLGTVELANGANDNVFTMKGDYPGGGAGPRNIWMRGRRRGIVDGNKSNQTFSGSRGDHTGILIWPDARDVYVTGLEVRNVLAGAGISFVGDDPLDPSYRCGVRGCYVHDTGTSSELCDGIYSTITRGRIEYNVVENVTDTHIATDDSQFSHFRNNICVNTSSYNTNVQSAEQGMTCYAKLRLWIGWMEGNAVILNGNSTNGGITAFADNGHNSIISANRNRIYNPDGPGIEFLANILDSEVTGNYVSGAVDGIVAAGARNRYAANTIKNSTYGIDRTSSSTDTSVYALNVLSNNSSGAFNGTIASSSVEGLNVT